MENPTQTKPEGQPLTIADLYPDMNEAELAEAEYNLKRYLEIVRGIFERTQI